MTFRRADESGAPIMIEGADTEGHSWRGFVSEEDERVLEDALRGRAPGPITVRLEPADEDDVEGHGYTGLRSIATVRVALDDDDTEGHVINVHFPTAEAADAFRRRLLATGLIAATLTIGAVGAATLPNLDIGSGAGAGAGTTAEQAWQESSINEGARQGVTEVTGWPADARISAEAGAQEAAANEAWQQASINEGARQSGATSTGPMDVNEARALQAERDAANEAWQRGSINEGLRQSGIDQPAGPMDVNEAAALRAAGGTDVDRDAGLMDPVSRAASDRQAALDAESDRLQGMADASAADRQAALDAQSDRLQGMADAENAPFTGTQAQIDALTANTSTDAETRGGWEASIAPSQASSADTQGGWEASLAPSQASSADADRDIGIMDASGAAAGESSGESEEDTAPPGRGGVRPR